MMQSEAPSTDGPWPTVDYQAFALAKSGIYLKSGTEKTTRKRVAQLIKPKKKLLQKALQIECQKLFIQAAGHSSFVRADPDILFGALCELCRHRGIVPVPVYDSVQKWIDSSIYGDSYSQVLSLSEFSSALKALCPEAFNDVSKEEGFPPIAAAAPVKDLHQSFGMARRKHNAAIVSSGVSKVEARGDRSINSTMVLVADSDHLCEAMKRDGRSARKFERKPGAYADKLQKDRIKDILRRGPDPGHTVRTQRLSLDQRKAREKYSSGLSTSLGCNMSMVQRHMDLEAHTKKQIMDQKVIEMSVSTRKDKAESIRKFNEVALKKVRDQKATNRRKMMEDLKKSATLKQESLDADSALVRSSREVLHWAPHKSGLIPKDALLAEKKANATSYNEWRSAADEDAMREGSIRDERLALMVQDKLRNGTLRSPVSMGSVDGSNVFMKAFTTDEDDYAFTETFGGGGVFLDNANGPIAEAKLPANMLAAARVYGQYPEVRRAPFMSDTIKGPKPVGYAGPRV